MIELPQYYDQHNIITEILRIWQSRRSRRAIDRLKQPADFQHYKERWSVDKTLFVCPKCRLVFEVPNQYNNHRETHYYHIPTIGKRQKCCEKCRRRGKTHD